MNDPAPDSEPLRPRRVGDRSLHANKACEPCRARKVKCDAAVVGLPCSSCNSRQRAADCILPTRKRRTRVYRGQIHVTTTPRQNTSNPLASDETPSRSQSRAHSTSGGQESQLPSQLEPDLLYVHILNDGVTATQERSQSQTASTTTSRTKPEETATPRNGVPVKLPQIDVIDREYLDKKGVFDLPPLRHLDALVRAYFDHIHPLVPVINRVEFIRHYQSGDCSLLLLRVMMTIASLHAPADVLSACGFANRSAAQDSYFVKAKLLYDVAAEYDQFLMLQVSIIMCIVIPDHPTDRDFGYWFHNAIGLATKLNVRDIVLEETKPREVLRLYRKIWWALYNLDVFHIFLNVRRSRLLEDNPNIKVRVEDEWEDEDASGEQSGLLSAVSPQQMALPAILSEVSRIFGECLSDVKSKQDPHKIMKPVDAWRKTLASTMHFDGDIGTNIYYLNVQATSYRFECILCRLMRRIWQRSGRADWSDWAKQRFRSAILELDTIVMRALASGALEKFPITFVTTIPTLLALHIESALDPAETQLIRSMSQISINQAMLVLSEGREIPVLRRALPIFEKILAKRNLYLMPSTEQPNLHGPMQPPSQDRNISDTTTSLHTQIRGTSPELEQWPDNLLSDINFLEFDFLGGWQQNGQLELFD